MPATPSTAQPRRLGVWFFFSWLVAVHAALSYFPIPLDVKLWLVIVGWLLPLVIFFRRFLALGEGKATGEEGLPAWMFWAILTVSVLLRLAWFGDFPNWPIYDEMINGYFAMKLNQHWDWRAYFFWTQLPPFLIWMLALLFKILPSTLFSIRLLPILISMGILPVAYGAIRQFSPQPPGYTWR